MRPAPSLGSIRKPKVATQYEDRFAKTDAEEKGEEDIGLEDMLENTYVGNGPQIAIVAPVA